MVATESSTYLHIVHKFLDMNTHIVITTMMLASYPGPSLQEEEEEEKGPGTHCARMHWDLHSDRSCYHSDHSRVLHDVQVYGR
jgi:hypothetical protein